MQLVAIATLGFLGCTSAFAPVGMPVTGRATRCGAATPLSMTSGDQPVSRGEMLGAFAKAAAAAALTGSLPALAEEAAAPAAPAPAPEAPPTDWGMTRSYYEDAKKMVTHMRYCTNMEKGTPDMDKIATNCRREMTDFVALYRRSTNISGKLSYSNLYTSISVLAGHYASYGPKFPVPEKRRKRLNQEYTDIERAIKRQR